MSQVEKWQAPDMTTSTNKVIRDLEIAADLESEQRPDIPTANEIEQWRKDAQDEGYQEGLNLANAKTVLIQKQLQKLISFFEHPLKSLNQEVEEQLSHVAVILAQQLVKRELKIKPDDIIELVRDLVELLPGNARGIRIFLHPEDVVLVRNAVLTEDDSEEQSWKLIEDRMITQGGCKIKSELSSINATLEKRLVTLAESILGGKH